MYLISKIRLADLKKTQSVHLTTRQILYQQSCFQVKYYHLRYDKRENYTLWAGVKYHIYYRFNKNENEAAWLERVWLQAVCVLQGVEHWTVARRWRSLGLMGIVPEWQRWDFASLPPSSPLFLPLLQSRCKIWCTPAARLKERNKHRHTCTKAAASWKCAKWFWKRGEAASLWCVTQISAELSVCRKKTSLLLWIHKGSRLCSPYVRRTRRSALNVWREWSHFHSFVCLFHLSALPSLAVAVSVYYQDTGWVGSTAPPAIPPSFSWKTASICTFLL